MTADGWSLALLGVIALALVVMTVVQVMVAFEAAKVSRQAAEAASALQRDLKPLLEKANRVSEEAVRASALAVAQVERVDRLMASAAGRIDETLELFQTSVARPMRQGAAVLAAVRAAVGVFRGWQEHNRQVQDEEEALFVG